MEIHALAKRGWSIAAIARHTGRDRKTVRTYLRDDRPKRPPCTACRTGTRAPTTEIDQEPGEELQLDWWEPAETPWGERAYILVGALSHSGRLRAAFSEGQSFPHLIGALDGVLRRFGGTAKAWRTDRMATVVAPGAGRIRAEFAAVAKHYGVSVDICPPRRPQRKGVVESGIGYLARSWWRSAPVATPAQAKADLDRFCATVADTRRRRGGTVGSRADPEPLLALPAAPFPHGRRGGAGPPTSPHHRRSHRRVRATGCGDTARSSKSYGRESQGVGKFRDRKWGIFVILGAGKTRELGAKQQSGETGRGDQGAGQAPPAERVEEQARPDADRSEASGKAIQASSTSTPR